MLDPDPEKRGTESFGQKHEAHGYCSRAAEVMYHMTGSFIFEKKACVSPPCGNATGEDRVHDIEHSRWATANCEFTYLQLRVDDNSSPVYS